MGNTHSHTHAELTHRLTQRYGAQMTFGIGLPFATHKKVSQIPITLMFGGGTGRLFPSAINFKFHTEEDECKDMQKCPA